MEGRQRRSFTDDYKRQAVDLVASSGRSIGSVAKELGLRDSVLRRGVGGVEGRGGAGGPKTRGGVPSGGQAAEIARLQRENERLRMERDILKMQHGQKPHGISLPTSRPSTIEPVVTPPSAISARSRWS